MKTLIGKCNKKAMDLWFRFKCTMKNNDGDQITGWLIVILLVVVVGAFFLNTYRDTIVEVWEAIVDKIYDTFGL